MSLVFLIQSISIFLSFKPSISQFHRPVICHGLYARLSHSVIKYGHMKSLSISSHTNGLSQDIVVDSELVDALIEEMSPADKYGFLIQSYSSKIIEGSSSTRDKFSLG